MFYLFVNTNQLPWTADETELLLTGIIHHCVDIVKFYITYKIQCMDTLDSGIIDLTPEFYMDLLHLGLIYFSQVKKQTSITTIED
jgi:hypothetical protein